jgi:hypothetical protein
LRISHSALQVFLECRYKYFLSYLLKLRPKAKRSPLAFGDSIDVGLNTLLSTRDLPGAMVAFGNQWLKYKDVGVVFSKSDLEEHLFEEGETPEPWESLKRRGLILLEEFNSQIMPRIKEVIAVQIDQNVKNATGDELVIKTDFICRWEDDRIILFDNKTSSMKYAEDSVRVSEQLAIYYEVLRDKYKIDAAGFIVIPKKINKKKLPRVNISVIIDQIDEATITDTLEQYDETLADIKTGQFPQNHSSCMGKFGRCDYYDYCHKNGNLDGLEYK